MSAVRVQLPTHLRTLAGVGAEVTVEVPAPPTLAGVMAALEEAHPALRGTIRDRATGRRRAFMRYFACGQDLSEEADDLALPPPVAEGAEALRIVGAIAGG